MKWQDIKVFVSSTFNDMHAERNYLATEVFPELVEGVKSDEGYVGKFGDEKDAEKKSEQ